MLQTWRLQTVLMSLVKNLRIFFDCWTVCFSIFQQSLHLRDPVDLQHCKQKLEQSLPIVTAIIFTVNNSVLNTTRGFQSHGGLNERPSISWLLEESMNEIEKGVDKISAVLQSEERERCRAVTSFLPSTGGRSAYNITKDQIEQLRDTGMNWKTIAAFLRVSERTPS